ncbi:MAG TPA: hypothetical protein VNF50_10315 [Acidimicrobiales bacterium]|nr:hypothetical protein [Acidimicrobiales bacterium]
MGDRAHVLRLEALEALARALNRVADAVVVTGIDGEELTTAVAEAGRLAERLEAATDADPWGARMANGRTGGMVAADFGNDLGRLMPVNPVVGTYNPLAPDLHLRTDGEAVVGRVYCGPAYMGPPGLVHGGVVSAILDQVLGMGAVVAGSPGFTGTLTIRYRQGTPIATELGLEARLLSVEGRRVKVWGAITVGGQITAEAEGVFIRPRDTAPAGMAR